MPIKKKKKDKRTIKRGKLNNRIPVGFHDFLWGLWYVVDNGLSGPPRAEIKANQCHQNDYDNSCQELMIHYMI